VTDDFASGARGATNGMSTAFADHAPNDTLIGGHTPEASA
jgi:hypothetical protein